MLSVLFEYTLPKQPDGKTLSLTEAVRGKLITLTGTDVAPSLDLVTVLLQKRRILVILDGLSESDEGTKQAIDPAAPSFVTNALIVTSRTEERLGGSAKRVVQPQRLKGQRVSFFIEAYLVRQGKQELYANDEELFETCRQLTRLVTDREVTVMLAKLFVDQTIAAKEGNEDIAMPHTLPELILGYVNLVNRPSAFALGRLPNDVVRKAAKCVAWACIERTFRPDAVEAEKVLQSLGGSEEARAQLEALERSGIIQVLPPLDRVRFVLDPLAEYLAGLHLVERYSEREESERKEAWRAFLEQTDRVPGAPEAITGFLLAVRDCCLARGTEAGIPAYIPSALAARARLAPTIDER
jgi:hypothetical protein